MDDLQSGFSSDRGLSMHDLESARCIQRYSHRSIVRIVWRIYSSDGGALHFFAGHTYLRADEALQAACTQF